MSGNSQTAAVRASACVIHTQKTAEHNQPYLTNSFALFSASISSLIDLQYLRCMSCHVVGESISPLRVQWVRILWGHQDLCSAQQSNHHRDWHCPVCLQMASFPVQTNCGHLFCAPCLIAYWRHSSWLDAISCPLLTMLVTIQVILGEITDYNKRYSGAPRRLTDYLCDAPLLLQLLARSLGTMGWLVWLFFFRVALCCVGTVVSISSSSASALETDPSLCGLLGVLDDLVVIILLLICVINVNQQMVPERGRHSVNTMHSHGVMGNSL
uniref:Si:dkey-183n20.15 n=1 Tax=Echeneis naucrates TaxID=173247 RepID=A0A665UAW7_ECHNA